MIAIIAVTAALVYVCECQNLLPLPPPPRKYIPNTPFSQAATLATYCNLQYPETPTDPTILSFTNSLPRSLEDNLLRDAPQTARAYKQTLMTQRQFNDQVRSRQQAPPINSDPPLRYLTPTAISDVCTPQLKAVNSVVNDNEVCFTFQEEEVQYAECSSQHADIHNDFPEIHKFYCVPENYRYITILVICPESKQNMFRWHTIYVPTNCCAKRYLCDFKPYQSLNGPRMFP